MRKKKVGTRSLALVAALSTLSLLLALAAACHVDALLGTRGGGGGGGGGLGLSALTQLKGDSATTIPVGGSIPDPSIVARAVVRDSSATASLRLEVEVQPVGTAFQDHATGESDPAPSGDTAYVRVGGLSDNTAYHWQARVVNATGDSTAWQAYGANAETAPDLRIAMPAASARLVFQTQPPSTTAGVTMGTFKVAVVDGQGATITSFTGTVFLSVAQGPSGGTLDANATASAGVATFSSVTMTTAGTYRLTATADGAADGTSSAFAINPADKDHLVFISEPSNTAVNQAIAPPVRVAACDVYGNVLTGFTDVMFMDFASNPGGGTLQVAGTHRAAAAGIATFEDLRIDRTGSGYRLLVSAANFRGATSNAFEVRP